MSMKEDNTYFLKNFRSCWDIDIDSNFLSNCVSQSLHLYNGKRQKVHVIGWYYDFEPRRSTNLLKANFLLPHHLPHWISKIPVNRTLEGSRVNHHNSGPLFPWSRLQTA